MARSNSPHSTPQAFGSKLANYVNLHDNPTSEELIRRAKDVKDEAERAGRPVVNDYTKKQLPPHEVFNNALMRAEAAGETATPDLFQKLDKEYSEKKKEKRAMLPPPRSPLMPALLGAAYGTVGGGLIAPKGKLLKYMLGGAASGGALGGAMGLGHNLGYVAGDALSRGMGMDEKGNASAATQIAARLAGLGGGAYLGLKAHKRIGEELEHEDEPKKKEKEAMSLYSFGTKLAKSVCSPCDMPNSPTNKKHMTGASPAVLAADEKSEELGRPEAEHTEHSEEAVNIPGKKAMAFGRKIAAINTASPTMYADAPKPAWHGELDQANMERSRAGLMANLPVTPGVNLGGDRGMGAPAPDKLGPGGSYGDFFYRNYVAPTLSGANSARLAAGNAIGNMVGSADVSNPAAWGAAPQQGPLKPVAAPKAKSIAELINTATKDTHLSPSEEIAGMNVDGTFTKRPVNPAPLGDGPKADPSLLSQALGHPYTPYIAGGLGATGLAALVYHLMHQKKKKPERDEEENA